MAGEPDSGGLPEAFVLWWIAAFVVLIVILIVATIWCRFLAREPEGPCS